MKGLLGFYKLLSGRYLLTIVAAISFLIVVRTICSIMIVHADEFKLSDILSLITPISLIISNVFTFYFFKQSMKPNGENGDNGDNETLTK